MKQIRNLYSEILAIVAEEEGKADPRFHHWIKRVDSVDSTKSNGYAFEGDFINEGTVEIEVRHTVYIVKTVRGSRKYQNATYNVIVMDAEGNLALADIHTTDRTQGWALRIREAVAQLVAAQVDEPQSITITIAGSSLDLLNTLRERLPDITDAEVVTAALNIYEMETRQ